jgi:hypothetical protein
MDEAERLHTSVDALCRFIESLPPSALVDQPWGPKEVLAHLVYWHETYVTQLQAILTGRPYLLPEGRFRDINARAVEQGHHRSVAQQVARLRAADRRLTTLARDPSAATAVMVTKQEATPRRLPGFLDRVDGHIRGHLHALRHAHKPLASS